MPIKTLLVSSLMFLASAAHAATSQPKVVFFGDDFLYQWQIGGQFNPNGSNWVGAGFSTAGKYGFIGSNYMASQFQEQVVDQHPEAVVLIAGASDMSVLVPNEGVLLQNFAKNMNSMLNAARSANIKVILTTVPTFTVNAGDQPGTVLLFNEWIEQFGAANGLQVLNYHDLLCQCVSTTAPVQLADVFYVLYSASGPGPAGNPGSDQLVNDAGFWALNTLTENAIAATHLQFEGGYLGDVATRPDGNQDPTPQQNNVPIGSTIQFTPQAVYSDGVARPVTNTDLEGHTGVWTSSDPAVVTIDQEGLAFAVGAGKATIVFHNSAGVRFSSWVMTITGW